MNGLLVRVPMAKGWGITATYLVSTLDHAIQCLWNSN